MTPDDLAVVARSWAELRTHRSSLLDRLTVALATFEPADEAMARARRLVDSTSELIGLLATPSKLAGRAREIATGWGDGVTVPTFGIDGRAWLRASSEVSPTWTVTEEVAWRRAWLLLADVLAEDSLAPFGGPLAPLPVPYVAMTFQAT